MSIEKTIAELTTAINNLAAAYAGKQAAPTPAPITPAPVAAPVQQPIAPQAIIQPAAPAMPAFVMPTATPAPVAPVAPTAPFTDAKGLLNYVMESYKLMGPAKGANIQGVLGQLGIANINDVKPEQYPALFAGVEALKRS